MIEPAPEIGPAPRRRLRLAPRRPGGSHGLRRHRERHRRVVEDLAHRDAVDAEDRARRVVRLHERGDGEALAAELDDTRRRARPALELVADHAGAAPDVALGHGTGGGSRQRLGDVLRVHVLPADVVQVAVPGLPHVRHAPVELARPAGLDLAPHQGVADHSDAVRVGQGDGRHQEAALADPLEAGELAVAVQGVAAGEERLLADLALVRHDHRHAGAHRPLADDKGPVALDERDGTDAHAGDVGDRVERAGRAQTDLDAYVTRSHTILPDSVDLGRARLSAPCVPKASTTAAGRRPCRESSARESAASLAPSTLASAVLLVLRPFSRSATPQERPYTARSPRRTARPRRRAAWRP